MNRRRGAILWFILYGGLLLGGLRHPLFEAVFSALIWITAMRSPIPNLDRILKLWGVWLLWAGFSSLASDQPWICLPAFSRWLTLIAFFKLCRDAHEQDFKWYLAGLMPAGIILAAAAFFMSPPGHPFSGLIPPYYNYTMFAVAAIFAAGLAVMVHGQRPPALPKSILSAAIALFLILIIKSASRGALAGVCIAATFLAVRHGKTKYLLAGFLVSVGLVLAAPRNILAPFLKYDKPGAYQRPRIWKAALQVAAEHPFLGVGPGNFEQGFLRHNFPAPLTTNYGFSTPHAHSEPLELAACVGWVGLALFMAALASSLVGGPKTASLSLDVGRSALAAMAVHCLVDNMLHLPALGLLFFSSLAWSAPGGGGPRLPRGVWKSLTAAGLALSLAAPLPRLIAEHTGNCLIFPAEDACHEKLAYGFLSLNPPALPQAQAELERAWALNQTHATYPFALAKLAVRRGDKAGALGLASQAIALEPNYLNARILRATLTSQLGLKQTAAFDLSETLKRRKELQGAPLYSGYDRAVMDFDDDAFTAAWNLATPNTTRQ